MSEFNIQRFEAYVELRDEMKGIRSLRKAAVKLLGVKHIVSEYVNDDLIEIGLYWSPNSIVYDNVELYNNHRKGVSFCFICKSHSGLTYNKVLDKNWTAIKYNTCANCINKKLCLRCLRETSRCLQIQKRKTTVWLCLLQNKFPKDIIRLIIKNKLITKKIIDKKSNYEDVVSVILVCIWLYQVLIYFKK